MIEMVGKTFGQATVISSAGRKNGRLQYLCLCSCGNEFLALGENLRSLHTRSCGCYQKSQIRKIKEKHGEKSFYNKSVEYSTWKSMRGRCNNKNNPRYDEWGGRGIKICDRWDDFANFLSDMGRKPSPEYSIDRIDNNGNYEPENCRWAKPEEQANNKRNNVCLTLDGVTKTMKEWSDQLKINYGTLQSRIDTGWTHEESLTTPTRKKR